VRLLRYLSQLRAIINSKYAIRSAWRNLLSSFFLVFTYPRVFLPFFAQRADPFTDK